MNKENCKPNALKDEIEGIAKISIEDFAKVDLRVAKITACEQVKKAKKLLKLTLDVGTGEDRTVASGIAQFYKCDELVNHRSYIYYLLNILGIDIYLFSLFVLF